jgi:hypothetical protein
MANTYTLIQAVTVGSGGAANIEFTSIPATYTDLVVLTSLRGTASAVSVSGQLQFNSSTSGYGLKYLTGSGTSASSGDFGATTSLIYLGDIPAATGTTSTFANVLVYVPNYAGSNNKSISVDGVEERNNAAAYATLVAAKWDNASAITSVKLYPSSANWVQYSTAYLYGISSS